MESSEKYQPTPEEIKKAAEMFSPKEYELSKRRESLLKYEIKNECGASEDEVQKAKNLLIKELLQYNDRTVIEEAFLWRDDKDNLNLTIKFKELKSDAPMSHTEATKDIKNWINTSPAPISTTILIEKE